MPRPRRSFAAGTSYHVTMRCNNQAFDIRRPQARKVILFCLSKAQAKFDFQLSGLCVMSNHVHYLIRPARPEQMPRLMHWLNWYSAMLLNRLLHRRGHFWEQRYHAVAVPDHDTGHALRVLRYIHANPKAAGMIAGFDYAYSTYRSYVRPAEDGLTAWHPARGATNIFAGGTRPKLRRKSARTGEAGSFGRISRSNPLGTATCLVARATAKMVPGITGEPFTGGRPCQWLHCDRPCSRK